MLEFTIFFMLHASFYRLKSRGAGAGKRKAKAAKDPNKPKRPPSAFFVFMYEFYFLIVFFFFCREFYLYIIYML